MLELKQVCHSFDHGKTFAVDNVSMHIQAGEIIVLLGASGSGKTTLLKTINRLIIPTSGKIYINGRDNSTIDIVQLRRSIGYVFQSVGLFPHMTIEENISVALRVCGIAEKQCTERVKALLDFVNLEPTIYARRMPDELSGGEQQRVGLGRALANDPDYLLLDEPFAALDTVTRFALQKDLLALHQKLKKTILLVTHYVQEALHIADHIAVMNQGKIEQIGSPQQIVQQPATEFVKQLFNQDVHYANKIFNR